jgi:uncharacterized phiE125 gp8 family phage protein
MNLKLITDVATEPLTLLEATTHLRLDTGELYENISTVQSIKPAQHAISTVTGTSVDILGKMAIVNLNAGVCAGTVTVKIQESDNNTNWTDYYTFTAITTANDEQIFEKQYDGNLRYIRVIATVASSASNFSVDVILHSGETAEATYISNLITVAREYAETVTSRALATQTWDLFLDQFPTKDYIELPKAPLQSVTSVSYKDSVGTETTMTPNTDYIVDADSFIGKIFLPYSKSWASFTAFPYNAVKIRFVSGYNTTTNLIPKAIKQAILILIGHWYENREALGNVGDEIKMSVNSLLWTKKVIQI